MNFSRPKRYAHYIKIPQLAILQVIRVTPKTVLKIAEELGLSTDDVRILIRHLKFPKFDDCEPFVTIHNVDREVQRYGLTANGRQLLKDLGA